MLIKNKLTGWLLMLSVVSVSAASPELTKGKALYATCVACHQEDGRGNMAMKAPGIGGQESWYIEAQLKAYKDGIRGADPRDLEGMMMAPMSKMLVTDEDVAAVAAYVSSLKPETIEHNTANGDAHRGKELYKVCMACHGDKGQGSKDFKAPRLNALNDWYLRAQIIKFRTKLRGSHPKDLTGMVMRPMALTLADDQAIHDVIAYIKTLSN